MMKKNYKESFTFWPEDPEDGVAEKPIVIEVYSDSVYLIQKENEILIQLENIDGFIKALRKSVKP